MNGIRRIFECMAFEKWMYAARSVIFLEVEDGYIDDWNHSYLYPTIEFNFLIFPTFVPKFFFKSMCVDGLALREGC